MELMMIKREIKTLSKKVKKIIVDVEKLEKSKSVVEVFDFKNKWHLVEPHLSDPYILFLLDDGMERFCIQHKWRTLPDWDRKNVIGPWRYSRLDSHSQEILDKTNEDPECNILEKKYINICEKMGIDFDNPDMYLQDFLFEDNGPKFKIIADNYQKEWNKIEEKHSSKPNTYKWYQCFGACYFLAEWQEALAKKVFPNFKWLTIQNRTRRVHSDSRYGSATAKRYATRHYGGHSTTIGIGPKGKKMIFDILLFDNTTLDKILDAADVDLTKL